MPTFGDRRAEAGLAPALVGESGRGLWAPAAVVDGVADAAAAVVVVAGSSGTAGARPTVGGTATSWLPDYAAGILREFF